ncbi:hypothetical protein BJX61DRAFT_532446 [Aspergillus egyptiacus]|nr:hypothetical protein BJX61DRAFT_532446 [Aspergillus egyptiacus]
MVQGRWGNELLCTGAGAGCMPIVQRLIANAENDAGLRDELLFGSRLEQPRLRSHSPTHQSIGEAVMGNHINVVEYLLGKTNFEVHLRYRNSHGENVLHLASRLCNPEMFRLLVPRFQDGLSQLDHHGDTALVRIIMRSPVSGAQYESARIMLESDINPLRAAVQIGDLDMCRALINIGNMDPLDALTRDSEGRMVLKDELLQNAENKEQILQFLSPHAMAN